MTSNWLRLATLVRAVLAAGIVAWSAAASSQAPSHRIGLLLSGSEASSRHYVEELLGGLKERGYVPGKNVTLVYRYAGGDMAKLPQLARELVADKVDLLFAGGDQGTTAAKGATQTIPIVMVACDALAAGLITNLARPGGNLTGVTCIGSELAAKRFELMRSVLPASKVFGVVLNPEDVRMRVELGRTEESSRAAGMSVRVIPTRTQADISAAFKQAGDAAIAGVIVVFDSVTFFHRKALAEAAIASKTATIFNFREYVEAGGLMSYGPSLGAMYRQSTTFMDRILKGASPGELPVQQPTHFELVINNKTAKAIGLQFPQSLLLQVDHVIE